MKLKSYLKREYLTYQTFGERVGCTAAEIGYYCNGRVPRQATMVRIFEATGGEVSPNDFYDLPALGERRRHEPERVSAHSSGCAARPSAPSPRPDAR